MTPPESFAAPRVAPDLWPYREQYRAFIGPRCPECSRRGCDDLEHLEAVRAGVQRTMGVGEMARVLGVTKPTGGRS